MIVQDIMTKDIFTASENDPISGVATLLSEKRIHGVPVVDENKKIIGIITETDFFTKDASSIHLPSFIDFIKNEKIDSDVKNNQAISSILGATVKDIMTAPSLTVSPEMPIQDLINFIKDKNLKTVPVADKDNTLVGIVAVADIIKLTLTL